MDEQKKQKVLLGVLAACILGAGSIFFLTRNSDNSGGSAQASTPAAKKTRATVDPQAKKERPKERATASADEAEPTEKRARDVEEEETREKKERGTGPQKKKKEKQQSPAA